MKKKNDASARANRLLFVCASFINNLSFAARDQLSVMGRFDRSWGFRHFIGSRPIA
jgi:hypothetical protein